LEKADNSQNSESPGQKSHTCPRAAHNDSPFWDNFSTHGLRGPLSARECGEAPGRQYQTNAPIHVGGPQANQHEKRPVWIFGRRNLSKGTIRAGPQGPCPEERTVSPNDFGSPCFHPETITHPASIPRIRDTQKRFWPTNGPDLAPPRRFFGRKNRPTIHH